MASAAHCAYCFDVLSAHLSRRDPLPLPEVQDSWGEYFREPTDDPTASLRQIPALRRLANASADAPSSLLSSSSLSVDSSSSAAAAAAASGISTPSISASSISTPGISTPDTSVSDLQPGLAALPATAEFPLFVTWNTVSATPSKDYRSLRGCIGTFEARPLADGLAEFALTAALEDTRFEPIRARELPRLEVAVTLLTDFEDAADDMDWTIGEHGLRISFWHNGRRFGATYLPDVAAEQGWTKEETLISLMRKAGWMGSRSRWRDVTLRVVRYKGKKASLPYSEYEEWMRWRDAGAARNKA